jgi:hypothetical protein
MHSIRRPLGLLPTKRFRNASLVIERHLSPLPLHLSTLAGVLE